MSGVYENFTKRRNPSSTWNYFLCSLDRKTAKCKMCSKIIKTYGSSTSGLHGHLKTKHGLRVEPKQKRRSNKTKEEQEDSLLIVIPPGTDTMSFDETPTIRSDGKPLKDDTSSMDFTESKNSAEVWKYFLKSVDRESAKCKFCSRVLKTNGSSTSSMHSHLNSKHNLNILKKVKKEKFSDIPISYVVKEEAHTYNESDLDPVYNNVEITQTFDETSFEENAQNLNSSMKIISRMVALDGVPLTALCESIDLRQLISQRGFELPSSGLETVSLLLEQTDVIKAEITNELKNFKSSGLKFSLTFEKYTTTSNKTYTSMNIYNEDSKFGDPKNLGLLKITRAMDNYEIVKMIIERLQCFDINLYDDIISFTSNTLFQLKVDKTFELDHQICLAQGIQDGVIEVLYKEEDSQVHRRPEDSDDDDDDEYTLKENAFFVQCPKFATSPQLIYKDIVDKVRKLVRYYKNSPTRNEILQSNIRKKHDREINLTVDCKKLWSSLCEMIGRFLKLKDCIHESLTYMEMDLFINDEELQILSEIHDSLVVIKATVTALCKPSGNLLTADAALRFMLRKLDAQNNAISRRFAAVLRGHIQKRRTIVSSILQYLHDRQTYDKYPEDETFVKPTSEEIASKIFSLLMRLKPSIQEQANKFDYRETAPSHDPLESEDDEEMSIEKQLENEIKLTCHNEAPKPKLEPEQLDLMNIIKGELSIYDSVGGSRGQYLTVAYELLLSVVPATAEADHFFYSRRDAQKTLSCQPELLLSSLFLLRCYFKEQRRLEESVN